MAEKKVKRESAFQREVIRELKRIFPGCIVMKNETGRYDGFPDLTVFIGRVWAMLEVKRSKDAAHRPNQDWWIDILNRMSFARFIYPENRAEVINELKAFVKRRTSGILRRKKLDIFGRRIWRAA